LIILIWHSVYQSVYSLAFRIRVADALQCPEGPLRAWNFDEINLAVAVSSERMLYVFPQVSRVPRAHSMGRRSWSKSSYAASRSAYSYSTVRSLWDDVQTE
jgi:hypothetical protein